METSNFEEVGSGGYPLESIKDEGSERLSGLNGDDLSQNAQHLGGGNSKSPPPVDSQGLKRSEEHTSELQSQR